ncbi:cellulase family glycosylhydrolase [Kiritimatiella glycovorans]|uniref:Putative glycosidase n=1 Tax=Kiritimatiella glycovorans TaxID=1307763 RepID=A0A0G3ELM9_9BACT|nr:cellulase family glycosylhydrolase [Kiritimatiella glycovorans]AKJ65700.1 putative glycosidase [Kiritimatiella glycovorans]
MKIPAAINVRTLLCFFFLVIAETHGSGRINDLVAGSGRPEPIEVAKDGHGFVYAQSRTPFVVWGVNYDHNESGRLLEDYWDDAWPVVREDFREMKALGANVVRIHLQTGSFFEDSRAISKPALQNLSRLLELAERTGLYLNITGLGCYHKDEVPAWYDAMEESERWKIQATFWGAVAATCAHSPAVFCYDLMNEPILPGRDKPADGWLAGEFGGKHFVQYITRDLRGRTRRAVARAWVETLTDAIRRGDPDSMITVGVIPWAHTWPNAKPIFYSPEVRGPLDFASVHFYPRKDKVEKALRALQVYEVGMPLVIEEMFPLRCSIEEMNAFIEGSRDIADGWISFYWGTTAEEYRAGERDAAALIKAAWLDYFANKKIR